MSAPGDSDPLSRGGLVVVGSDDGHVIAFGAKRLELNIRHASSHGSCRNVNGIVPSSGDLSA